MKDKIKNIAILVLSLIVVVFVVVPWLTGNDTGRSIREITPIETANPDNYQHTSNPVIELTTKPINASDIQKSPAASQASSFAPIIPADPTASIATQNPKKSVTVYVTASGKKYHKAGCQYLRSSCIAIDLDEAQAKGYTPCSKCHPTQ